MTDWKRWSLGIASIFVSGSLIYFLVGQIDTERTIEVIRKVQWFWLILAAICTCGLPFASAFRWRGILRSQDIPYLPFIDAVTAVMMANVLNSFLPSKTGDMAKAAYLRNRGGLSIGVGTVILERLVDLGILGVLGVIGLLWSGALWGLVAGAMLFGGVSVAFACILFLRLERCPLPGKAARIIQDLRTVFLQWSRYPAAIVQTLSGSFITWSLAALTVCTLVRGFGANISWGYVYSIFPLAVLAGLIPVTISGIGTRDSAFVVLLSGHMPLEEATLISIGYTFFAYWFLSLVSLPLVAWEIKAYFQSRWNQKTSGNQK